MIMDVTITFVHRGRMKLASPIGTISFATARPVVPLTSAPITADRTAEMDLSAVYLVQGIAHTETRSGCKKWQDDDIAVALPNDPTPINQDEVAQKVCDGHSNV